MRWVWVPMLVALAGPAGGAGPPPWARTETREPCRSFDLLRTPFFGELHVHTRYSADAYIFGTRVLPTDAYAFARGAAIPFADDAGAQTRTAKIDRPLDFTAVTDHAEFFGEVRVCDTASSPAYDSQLCQMLRQTVPPDQQGPVTVSWLYPAGIPNPPHLSICQIPGVDCTAAAVSVWQDEQAAAEQFYDRTAACAFTTLIGYEYTASPLGKHLHRNVIFRNDHVPPTAKSYIETAAGGTPQGLWSAVETDCLNAGTGCDAVIIPHNSNLSGGLQFFDPANAAEAFRRQTLEPLVEIHQIKGNSECRFDRLVRAGAGTADELCTFEQEDVAQQGPAGVPVAIDKYPARNMVRNALKDGLGFEQTLGANPFRFGFVGGTDNHDGAPGSVAEEGWAGGQGNNDSSPARQIGDQMRTNPGGLTVAWAEENSRDAIFSALARRETYATSGTRPLVRFFAGDLHGVRCGSPTFVHDAYASGTPMGGEIGAVRGRHSPRFAVWAMKDPGTATAPGTDLQRIQIVKGWLDAQGKTHEAVYDVAGKVRPDVGVDPATCTPRGSGDRELCSVWRDPHFKPGERAFYYARVLEDPTCRWSTRVCKAAGVDPFASDCPAQAAHAGAAFADCCLGPSNDAFLDPVIQERAWTSPVWYRPEAIARLRAAVRYGARPATDRLALRLVLGGVPDDLDPTRNPLTVRVTDDDEIFAITFPPGALARRGRRFVLRQPLGGVEAAALALRGRRGATLTLRTAPLDLSHADRSEHMVTVALATGIFQAAQTRLWTVHGDRLVPEGR
ncbi:MAG TPA: DUF3604 domain-containing protein [Candidatus Binatia bacterium]|nr:DUF3604 domain-containing protein [Candidatus Binatia bacterium]